MIKRGFTLAEVLIVLATIGVVAALTIPTFVSSSRNQANAAKLSALMSDLENAFTVMITQEDIEDFGEWDSIDEVTNRLPNYFKVDSAEKKMEDYYGSVEPFLRLDDEVGMGAFEYTFLSKNGSLIMFDGEDSSYQLNNGTGSLGRVAIDVNGIERPNRYGRDVFLFRLGNDGHLYAFGSANASQLESGKRDDVWDGDSSEYQCLNDSNMTEGCTARLIENNFRIDF